MTPSTGSATVDCPADAVAAGETGSQITLPTVTDVCGNTLNPTLTTTPSAVSCEGDMVYVYTYEDCAGNTATYTFTYKIDMPEFTVTPSTGSATVDCPADVLAAGEEGSAITLPTVTDACGNTLIPDLTTEPESVDCEGEMVYVYTYTDCAGNIGTYTFTYTIDDAAPVIATIENQDAVAAGNCQYMIPDLSQVTLDASSDGCSDPIFVKQLPAAEELVNQTSQVQQIPVTVTIKDVCGHESEATITVIVPAKLSVTAEADPATIVLTNSSTLTATTANAIGTVTYSWTPSSTLDADNTASVTATPTSTGLNTYTVSVEDENGCTATTDVTIEVNRICLIITLDSTKIYDGTPFEVEYYQLYTEGLQEGHYLASGTVVTNDYVVGEYHCVENNCYAVKDIMPAIQSGFRVKDENNNDVTAQYIPSFDVKLKIVVRPITITAGSDEKPYDGIALTNSTYETNTGVNVGLAEGDVVNDLTITGSQLCVGESENEPSDASFLRTTDENYPAGRDVTFCYVETYVNGILTVTPLENAITCSGDMTITLADCETEATVNLEEPTLNVSIADGMYVLTNNLTSNKLGVGEHEVIWTLSYTADCGGGLISTCTTHVTVNYPPCDSVDYQGHTYPAVRIGSQCWLAENLRNEEDADGNPIANFRAINDDESMVEGYGYLYSWYSAVGVEEGVNDAMPTTYTDECENEYVRGICPENWGIPSQADVTALRVAVEDDASLLKDFNPQYWLPGANGVNPNTGFNAHAGGHYNSAAGQFEGRLLYAYFWESDSQPGASEVISVVISYYCSTPFEIISSKEDLRPVRCVRKVTPGM